MKKTGTIFLVMIIASLFLINEARFQHPDFNSHLSFPDHVSRHHGSAIQPNHESQNHGKLNINNRFSNWAKYHHRTTPQNNQN